MRVGIVPLLFANDDLPELTPPIEGRALLAEVARLGFEGLQLSRVLPRGDALRHELDRHGLRIAEVYAALPCSAAGPAEDAVALGQAKLAELEEYGADVLILSYHLAPERTGWAGRAQSPAVPRLNAEPFQRAVALLRQLASEARDRGHPAVYHPHAGSFVETPDEVERLMDATEPSILGLCLDTGHCTVGGGDPVDVLRRLGQRVEHVHLKDVDGGVLDRLRAGRIGDFLDALRERIFTELGSGVVDVAGIADGLLRVGYAGWVMCEQDTAWRPPEESAAISRRVWALALEVRGQDRQV